MEHFSHSRRHYIYVKPDRVSILDVCQPEGQYKNSSYFASTLLLSVIVLLHKRSQRSQREGGVDQYMGQNVFMEECAHVPSMVSS